MSAAHADLSQSQSIRSASTLATVSGGRQAALLPATLAVQPQLGLVILHLQLVRHVAVRPESLAAMGLRYRTVRAEVGQASA